LYDIPNWNKLNVGNDVTIWFTPCEPNASPWPYSIALYHLPSASAVYLHKDGSPIVSSGLTRYESDEGRKRLDAVLADDALMERIVARWPKSTRCPPEFLTPSAVSN
jgi:hypothetical protein